MSKILSVDDLLEIAQTLNLPNFDELKTRLELAADELAINVAASLGIHSESSSWQGKAFAGLTTTFRPSFEGQECPSLIHEADESGDWE
jgi:hypothetical protein